jgi:hypothetical protein
MHAAYYRPRNPNGPSALPPLWSRDVRAAVLALAVLIAGCGGSPQPPAASPANGETGTGRPPVAGPPNAGPPDAGPPDAGPPVAGPPDAGTRAGHGNDLAAQFERAVRGTVAVPARDRTPPLAMLRLDPGGGAPVVHDSPVRDQRRPEVKLPRPGFAATALIRDGDGGTGRVRVSVVSVIHCDGAERQQADYFPPAQIENVRIAPGVRVPAQRSRSARVRFPAGCDITGKAFAEATNAAGLESFSDPIWFRFDSR